MPATLLYKKFVTTYALCAEPPPVSEPRISEGHVFKGSRNIIGRSPSKEAIILPSSVAIDTLVIEI